MIRPFEIRNVIIGSGLPKICIPLLGTTPDDLAEEAKSLQLLPCQLVEWRGDYVVGQRLKGKQVKPSHKLIRQLETMLDALRSSMEGPIIFTIRTQSEGGQASLSREQYLQINRKIADSGKVDIIDIQLFREPGVIDEDDILDFIQYAHERGIKVILSSHDFQQTPDLEEMVTRLFTMQDLGADIPKLAVMPKTKEDVYRLLEAAAIMRDTYAKGPFIALSMGELGLTTRICGGDFGSAITFASGKTASAPGQIGAVRLSEFICQYY